MLCFYSGRAEVPHRPNDRAGEGAGADGGLVEGEGEAKEEGQ